MTNPLNRRNWIKGTAASAALASSVVSRPLSAQQSEVELPEVRTITQGPAFHWFGYYDKLEFDPTHRYVLSNEVTFEGRTPTANDSIAVGMVDTQQEDRWIPLGTSRAWGWQQGCMLQWRPGSDEEVVWNDREGDQHVCRIKNINTGAVRTLPRPVYTLSPDGRWALTADFSRIQRMRPGYGYVGLEDPCADQRAPEQSGVWKMDLDTGKAELIFSLAEAAAIEYQGDPVDQHWNYFNHLLINPASDRFIVLHRWRANKGEGQEAGPSGGFTTRMFTAAMDGSDRHILDPSGYTSHFIWRDAQHVCAWTKPAGKPAGFYLFADQTDDVQPVGQGVMTENGHNTYVPGTDNQWILNDTYPQRGTRMQLPYLYHVPSGRKIALGQFHSPEAYTGEWRCDTHPRCSNDGRTVAIDSPHNGQGRQVHLIDIGPMIDQG